MIGFKKALLWKIGNFEEKMGKQRPILPAERTSSLEILTKELKTITESRLPSLTRT